MFCKNQKHISWPKYMPILILSRLKNVCSSEAGIYIMHQCILTPTSATLIVTLPMQHTSTSSPSQCDFSECCLQIPVNNI